MAALSTLELMLHDLQSHENLDRYADYGKMPMLPKRPVSKARMPTNRARRAVLSFHLQEFGGKMKEEFVNNRMKRNMKRNGIEFADIENLMKNGGEEKEEKGIIGIQKCFRGYQTRSHYFKLKEAIITLQSFIRGEKARKELQISPKRLVRTRINQDFVWKPLRNKEATVIYLQSVVRTWLSRRHLGFTENTTKELHEANIENLEHVTVSESYVLNLEQQVLRTEAALRYKKQENSNLELQIQEIDRKWELHNAKMNIKEKLWQDEFTSIQMKLESVRETTPNEISRSLQTPTRHHGGYGETILTIRQILKEHENDSEFHVDSLLNSSKHHKQELRKLKGRFKAWMKEFKGKLHEVKRTHDRFKDESVYKTCFLR